VIHSGTGNTRRGTVVRGQAHAGAGAPPEGLKPMDSPKGTTVHGGSMPEQRKQVRREEQWKNKVGNDEQHHHHSLTQPPAQSLTSTKGLSVACSDNRGSGD